MLARQTHWRVQVPIGSNVATWHLSVMPSNQGQTLIELPGFKNQFVSHFLTEPHFLHAIEYGNYVYFFFREIAVEHNNLGKASICAWLVLWTCAWNWAHVGRDMAFACFFSLCLGPSEERWAAYHENNCWAMAWMRTAAPGLEKTSCFLALQAPLNCGCFFNSLAIHW